jgi:hypothetical protein
VKEEGRRKEGEGTKKTLVFGCLKLCLESLEINEKNANKALCPKTATFHIERPRLDL